MFNSHQWEVVEGIFQRQRNHSVKELLNALSSDDTRATIRHHAIVELMDYILSGTFSTYAEKQVSNKPKELPIESDDAMDFDSSQTEERTNAA